MGQGDSTSAKMDMCSRWLKIKETLKMVINMVKMVMVMMMMVMVMIIRMTRKLLSREKTLQCAYMGSGRASHPHVQR